MNSTLRALGILLLGIALLCSVACKPFAQSYITVGDDERSQGHWEEAIADYTHAIALDPKSSVAYSKRGLAKKGRKDMAGALADFEAAITIDPYFAPLYVNRGIVKRDTGDVKGAIADYTHAIALDPNNATAYNNRGYAQQVAGNPDAALADYNRAIEVDPKYGFPYFNRGMIEGNRGDQQGAIADFTRVIALDPNDALAYNNRGYAEQFAGDLNAAIDDYSHAIELDPRLGLAYLNRGCVNAMKRDWVDALADYQQAVDVSAQSRDYAQLYTWLALAHSGSTDAASKGLAAYLAQRPQPGKKAAGDDWFSKVAGHLLGTVTEADLLAAAASPDAKKDSGQHCEAWFYAGMKHLLSGDKTTAADYFHKCLATDQKDFIEYEMAQAELKALGQ